MTLDEIKDLFTQAGYVFFEEGDYNLNLFSIRKTRQLTDRFDDSFFCVYTEGGEWVIKEWDCTTKPGLFYLQNPMNAKGTGIIAPGQYRRAYTLGLHKGKPALVQIAPVTAYRDRNRDAVIDYDPNTKDTGLFAANIHRAGVLSEQVGKWSAMCTVFKRSADLDELLGICRTAAGIWGDKFTYTVFENEA